VNSVCSVVKMFFIVCCVRQVMAVMKNGHYLSVDNQCHSLPPT